MHHKVHKKFIFVILIYQPNKHVSTINNVTATWVFGSCSANPTRTRSGLPVQTRCTDTESWSRAGGGTRTSPPPPSADRRTKGGWRKSPAPTHGGSHRPRPPRTLPNAPLVAVEPYRKKDPTRLGGNPTGYGGIRTSIFAPTWEASTPGSSKTVHQDGCTQVGSWPDGKCTWRPEPRAYRAWIA